ncbi:MAG: glycosyltransferase family 1 protein, partial [Anaerolineae bacterium]|nr:glycosyltransferase family 1 protein [Anaerolineae bacterium]
PHTIAQAKRHYGIQGDYLLYLGTLHPRKNLGRLIDAFQQAIKTVKNQAIQLVIAGKPGWLYNAIYEQVQQLGLTNRVIFPGYIAAAHKPALLSGAKAYVFPSLYEGFGLPVLEAMACGVPVLTSDVSSLPEVAGEAALLVNPHHTEAIAAGLIQLLNDAALRQSLIAQGFEQINKFSWRTAASQVLEILEAVGN